MAKEIADSKALSKDDWRFLRALVLKHAPSDPLRTITVRQHFDQCVEVEMKALKAAGRAEAFDKAGVRLRAIRGRLGLDYVPLGQPIHSTRELSVGQHVWVAPLTQEPPDWFRVGVEAIDEAHFHAAPRGVKDGATPQLSVGAEVRCRMWHEEDARYVFATRVVHYESAPPMWAFEHTSHLDRVQARAYYRIHHEQTAMIGVVNAPLDDNLSDVSQRPVITRLRGQIISLSAGGIAVVSGQPIPKQVILRVPLELGQGTCSTVDAKIVVATPLSAGRYLVRAVFINMEDDVREDIAHYVVQRQQPLLGAENRWPERAQ